MARTDLTDQDLWNLWSAGWIAELKLHSEQLRWYEKYREWERLDPAQQAGLYPRVFGLDVGKRTGKTTWCLTVKTEDCIRNPGHVYRYSTAFQKDIEEILDDVSGYVFDDCPLQLRPKYHASSKAKAAGLYFPNGSVLRLVGLDKNPDGIRGRSSDGDVVSEAAFLKGITYVLKNVIYHQYQGKPHARCIIESSAPLYPDTEYDTVWLDDCKARGAYVYATIDDNPRLTHEEREEFIRASGGREHPDTQREYFNIRVRDPQRLVIPEFKPDKHIIGGKDAPTVTQPKHALAFAGADPGTRDKFGLVFGYLHFELGDKLIVQRDYAQSNVTTSPIAAHIKETERELWAAKYDDEDRETAPALQWWDGRKLRSNPHSRISDTEARLINDMIVEHGINMLPANKSDGRDATLYSLRNAFLADQILIDPSCTELIAQLTGGHWNEKRTDFERSPKLGHLDCIMALAYMWRGLIRGRNPNPPGYDVHAKTTQFVPPVVLATANQSEVAKTLNRVFGDGRRRR